MQAALSSPIKVILNVGLRLIMAVRNFAVSGLQFAAISPKSGSDLYVTTATCRILSSQ